MIRITRCVCTDQTFADLLAVAEDRGLDLEGLSAATRAGAECSRCVPYLRAALRTGQTVFRELLPDVSAGVPDPTEADRGALDAPPRPGPSLDGTAR